MTNIYPIFLSSFCNPKTLWDLRARIFEEIGQGTHVYVDEKVKWRSKRDKQDNLEVADELIRRVREAKVFICVLGGSGHGSAIEVDTRPSAVSFFEIELYQATLLEKEIHLFIRDDFDPPPRLRNLLSILGGAFPEWMNKKRLNDAGILDEVRKLIVTQERKRVLGLFYSFLTPIRRFVQALDKARAKPVTGSPLFFLNAQFESRSPNPDLVILESLFNHAKTLINEEQRLSRLWIVLRELMCAPYTDTKDNDILNYWNLVLGQWAHAGAWYGLHGDTPLGCLAALNSMAEVRRRLSEKHGRELPPNTINYPGGALASAKYSIAKRLYLPNRRITRLNEALEDVGLAMGQPDMVVDGLLAIRGSILRELRKFSEAVADYEAVLRIRQQRGASEPIIGEALSELGYGYLFQCKLRRGRDFCEEGVRLLRSSDAKGFLARALRKLSVAYLVTGHPLKAYEAWNEGKQIAAIHGAFDQFKP